MNFERIVDELKVLIVEIAPQFSKTDIELNTNLINDLLFDSLMIMELVVRAEEQFDIEIDELNIDKIGVFGELCKVINGEL